MRNNLIAVEKIGMQKGIEEGIEKGKILGKQEGIKEGKLWLQGKC